MGQCKDCKTCNCDNEQSEGVIRVQYKTIPWGLKEKTEVVNNSIFSLGDRVYLPNTNERGEVKIIRRTSCGIHLDGTKEDKFSFFEFRFINKEEI